MVAMSVCSREISVIETEQGSPLSLISPMYISPLNMESDADIGIRARKYLGDSQNTKLKLLPLSSRCPGCVEYISLPDFNQEFGQ